MSDLGRQIRNAVDPVEPILLSEIRARCAGRRRRTVGRLAVVGAAAAAAAAAAAVVVAAVVTGHPAPTSVAVGGSRPAKTARPTSTSSSITRHGLTVTLTLNRTTVPTGTTIHGRLTVDNRTGQPYREGPLACAGDNFSVYLEGGTIPYGLGSPSGCTHPYSYRPGLTVFPFSVATTEETTEGTGTAPVPTGPYRATVEYATVKGERTLPAPPPLPVLLTSAATFRTRSVSSLHGDEYRTLRLC